MRVRVLKRGERFYPQKASLMMWAYFSEELSPDYSQRVSFDSLEKAMAFLKSVKAPDEVVFEGEI